jgi:hypothetical protein
MGHSDEQAGIVCRNGKSLVPGKSNFDIPYDVYTVLWYVVYLLTSATRKTTHQIAVGDTETLREVERHRRDIRTSRVEAASRLPIFSPKPTVSSDLSDRRRPAKSLCSRSHAARLQEEILVSEFDSIIAAHGLQLKSGAKEHLDSEASRVFK